MKYKIGDFVSFKKLKNGNYKVTHDENNLEYIYKLLREIGFGYVKGNSRKIYFLKESSTIHHAILGDLQKAFFKILKNCDYSNLPGDLTLFDIYKYYRRNPFKRDALFSRYFEYDLTEDELNNMVFKSNYTIEKGEMFAETLDSI